MTNVTVVGLGAMGGGMARSLLRSEVVASVCGFDLNSEAVSNFHAEAKEAGKAVGDEPSKELTLDQFVDSKTTDVVIVVLVNEAQCQSVCFDGKDGINLQSLVKEGATVMVSSTVTPDWSKRAHARFAESGIRYLDCPISGGPVRALAGEMTMMCSGDPKDLERVDPLFRAMGKEIHFVQGGAGMGSTVKMVHQLLAGVHIAVAAEALALGAKAGLDVRQLYDIVKGAAGNSWMFGDRGKRMIEYTGKDDEKVMSSLAIFIKDMDIVYSGAKSLKCPVPVATAALQQFIAGSGLGLERKDDSQVVKVYEALSGTSVSASGLKTPTANAKEGKDGNNIGDVWVLPDGTKETIVDCGDECHHHFLFSNQYTRVMKGRFCPNDTAGAHRHSKPSLYFFLSGVTITNHVLGSLGPVIDTVEFGEVRYAPNSEENPYVHRLQNISENGNDVLVIDAEFLASAPVVSEKPLSAKHHDLIKTRENLRVYKLTLEPNQSVSVSYPFFYLSVVLKGSSIRTAIDNTSVAWESTCTVGDAEWKSPSGSITITNTGDTVYEQFITEWC